MNTLKFLATVSSKQFCSFKGIVYRANDGILYIDESNEELKAYLLKNDSWKLEKRVKTVEELEAEKAAEEKKANELEAKAAALKLAEEKKAKAKEAKEALKLKKIIKKQSK